MSKAKIAPVTVVSGSHDYLRMRLVNTMLREAKSRGYRQVEVAAGDGEGLSALLSSGFLFADATIAVVESATQVKRAKKKKASEDASEPTGGWSEESLALLLDHAKSSDTDVVIIILHEGEAAPTSLAAQVGAAIPKQLNHVFLAPKPWDEQKVAVKFLLAEMGRHGKSMSEDLAESVVKKVGVEMGLLSFEALKFATLLQADGRAEATPQDVAPVMAALGTEDWEALKIALGRRDARGVSRAISDIRSGPGRDAVPKALSIVTHSLVQWMFAAALHESGVTPDEAAARAGVNPYRYKNFILPPATQWGSNALEVLYKSVVEVNVRKGHIDPWLALESTLVLGCSVRR